MSGAKLVVLLTAFGADVVEKRILADDPQPISELLVHFADVASVDVIFTTGGTGMAPRDNTPEATRAVIEREAPGIAEAMRHKTASKQPMAMLSRGVCGIRGRTLIVNLPGSPKGVEECFEVIRGVLAHAVGLIRGNAEH